ncbi:MAG: 5'-deoxynucleotidase [Erysipelotrichaceae bacterium]|nr:5'-deoxynucleotidase [Erysipelotrichaceae bacterium]
MKDYHFFATVSRMKYINRWALMRNSRMEDLSEHSQEVAMIAHALCMIGNVRYGRHLNGERAAVIALYHDASEIITGDLPTPVKYYSEEIRDAYKNVESLAEDQLLEELPDDLKGIYRSILKADTSEEDRVLRRYVKAADKLSALIKCIEEESAGNTEFKTAKISTEESLKEMIPEIPEIGDFITEFLSSYGSTLDELLSRH